MIRVRVSLVETVCKAKGSLPPARRAIRLEEVKQHIPDHRNLQELKVFNELQSSVSMTSQGSSLHTASKKRLRGSKEADMGDGRCQTKSVLECLTHW